MSNDFLAAVKPHFIFLVQERGYRLVDEHVGSSFDDGSLLYESQALRILVTRDRGQVSFTLRNRAGYRDVDEDILRLLLADAQHYSKPAVPSAFSADASARFLKERLTEIETLFDPGRTEETARRGSALAAERAEAMFGRVGRV